MKRFLALTTLLILTACTAAPTPSPSLTPAATLTLSPTATTSPTKTPSPSPTATPLYEPLEGPYFQEIARYNLRGRIERSKLSPDGSMLIVEAWKGVYLYDTDTLELRWHRQVCVEGLSRIIWTTDNQMLFYCHQMPTQLIDPEDGSTLREINGAINNCRDCPSPSEKYFATYNNLDKHSIYKTSTQELVLKLTGSADNDALVWMPDGEHLISFPEEGPVEIWNIERGEIVQELEDQYSVFEVWAAGFSPDERYFAYSVPMYDLERGEFINRVMVWDISTGEPLTINMLDGSPSDHDWQLDERTFVIGDGHIIRINGDSAEMTLLHETVRFTREVYEQPDGFLVVMEDAVLRYDKNFNLVDETIGHNSYGAGNTNKILSPDGQMLAIGAATRFYIWYTLQNELVTAITDLGGYDGATAAWSADSKLLAVGQHIKPQISLWDVNSRSIQKIIDLDYHICSIAWVDESMLALGITEEYQPIIEGTACTVQFLAVLDIETEQIIYREQPSTRFFDFFSLYDQRHIAFYEWLEEGEELTTMLGIWDSQTFQRSHTIELGSLAGIHRLQPSPGIVIDRKGTFRVINLETGKESVIKLDTERLPPYDFYLLGDHLLEYDFENDELRWYDLDGNLVGVSEMTFEELWAGGPIITADGRIFDVVRPYSKWSPGVALIELFPPEK